MRVIRSGGNGARNIGRITALNSLEDTRRCIQKPGLYGIAACTKVYRKASYEGVWTGIKPAMGRTGCVWVSCIEQRAMEKFKAELAGGHVFGSGPTSGGWRLPAPELIHPP
jgi:hypothetical protein